MPLLTSPIDGSPMRQINRYGIELDVCPTTGGVWLDKGELEKLMALIRQELEEASAYAPPPRPQAPPTQQQHHHHYAPPTHHSGAKYRYDDDDYKYGQKPYYKKKSKASKILDIFDF
jgi:hypothetical protein